MGGVTPVQASSLGFFSHTYTAQATLTGVTSGNDLLSITAVIFTDGSAPTSGITVSDGVSYSIDLADYGSGLGVPVFVIARHPTVSSGGSYTATVTLPSGTKADIYGETILVECPPLTLDKSNSNQGNSTTPTSGASGALTNANELLVCVLAGNSLSSGGTFPPTGGPGTFTSWFNPTSASDSSGDADYQVQTSGTSSVTASWGTLTYTGKWVAGIATYYAATSSSFTLTAAYGSFALTGIAASLAYSSSATYVMLCNPGPFDLVGAQSISQLSLYGLYGPFVFNGLAATLSGPSARILLANTGVFAETGGSAALNWFVSGSMPNFIGMDYYPATALAALLGLMPTTPIEVKSSSILPGTVVAQSIAPNSVIVQGAPITLSVIGDHLLATAYNEPPM